MELYNRDIMPFDAYLDVKSADSTNDAIARAAAYQTSSLSKGFGNVVASQQRMSAVMTAGFIAVTSELRQVGQSIEAMRSDFNWVMGEVLSKLEMQQKTLLEIATMLQAPLDTTAKELRRRAEFAYQNGWYQEALGDFLQAEQQNYQDFMVQQAIANIYLYHQRPADLEASREYYLKAAKYALPVSKYHSALAHMYAGFVCYLQRDDAAAIQNTGRAIQVYPQLSEAHFNHAKFAACIGRADIAIPSLEKAILADRKYAVKARVDSDFVSIESEITKLLDRLIIESRSVAEKKVQKYRALRNSIRPATAQQLLAQALVSAENSLKGDTYFSILEAIDTLAQVAYLEDKRFFDSNLVVTNDSLIVGTERFSLRNIRQVNVYKRREGWRKVVYFFDLYDNNRNHIYRISSENEIWVSECAEAVNHVIRQGA